ncbi:SPT3 Dosage dependent suppressor of Ty-induced promoter mutations-like protein [Vermiconidia calcicola]|uniref:SPT3 Dosage dependent suppressor of Ty-induced promoter mutations-like protein n=1 Tax=Vermiconidia calcicola TaxID=1690605 RepID=A0ACC3MW40_9PEZI|nr:SPT3 Dosage dependent suppressor of Ty-induced promoter mutations-like protein [Vermiconidia calcicola]
MSFGGESIDWSDPAFSTSEFQDGMMAESPWGNTAINDFTNLADYGESPAANFGLRTPSKSGPDAAAPGGSQQAPHTLSGMPSASVESSSQDSSSDTSSRRKRKTTSESPMSKVAMKEEPGMGTNNYPNMQAFEQTFNQPLPNLAVDHSMGDNTDGMFDFNSTASSPNLPRDFNQQLSLDAKMGMAKPAGAPQFARDSPAGMNPALFTLGGASRDQSPATNPVMLNAASPNAIFSTPSSDSNEPFASNPDWNANLTQNPAWPTDFNSQFASPNLSFTPSPATNGGTPVMAPRGPAARSGRSPLHIAPISAKSRVETQINVVMTLEKPPPGADHLHLPLHTIAKSKLLAKEDYDKSRVLELHTMLVCTSAMHNPAFKEKALKRAAAQNNDEIQRKAEQLRDSGEDEKNDTKNVDDEDRPANGGEVKICNNCIQRERKRAGRKKLKREEEQQHWERYETERVIVFNSNEFLPFKPFEHLQQPQRDGGMVVEEPYYPPEGAISVAAQMRIACYCRHQSEKEGFQVIFTLKDQQGILVAQEISDSILITDDHKTHPPQLTTMTGDLLYHPSQLGQNGLQTSYSMMDLPTHAQPFTSSRSAGNLQALAYGQQFNPQSHVHQLSNNGYASQTTSATMTPTSLSRPGSPTSAGQTGPNKKRKSSTFHRRLPSGLHMTPRVDTSQSQSANAASAATMSANFSPTGAGYGQQNDQSFMTIPNSGGPQQFFGSGPPTPAKENTQFAFGQNHQLDIARAQNASAYFSHPSSAVPSRSNSPILQHSRNMSGYGARQPIPTSTNHARSSQMYGGQAAPGATVEETDQALTPTITKITPTQGPTAGGTEVSVFGYNFTHSTQIMFGESIAPTTFYGPQSILAISPPGRRGQVRVKILPSQGAMQYAPSQSNNPIFAYQDTNPQMMEMALRFLSQQQTGDPGRWMQYTNEVANQFMQTSISPAGIQGQGYGGGNMLTASILGTEDMVLKIFDLVDASESPRQPCYDLRAESGQTILISAAALGMHRVAAALLARGANPDVRDKGGYTALMHAALHGRPKTCQLLLIKGADPALRSLKGYAAIDLVEPAERDAFLQILQSTKRSRGHRPSTHWHSSFGSYTSSKASWDISSASFYESEIEASEHHSSMPPSRRASANILHMTASTELPERSHSPPSAAMVAWRDSLAAQIYHFQQSVHSSMSCFQLPALPPLPNYHGNEMVRRLSALVSARYPTRAAAAVHVVSEQNHQQSHQPMSFWDMFSSASSSSSVLPPPYSELFPEEAATGSDAASKKAAATAVGVDAVADEKRMVIFDRASELGSAASVSESVQQPNKAEDTTTIQRYWMPLLVIVTSVVMRATMPYILSTAPTQAFDTLQSQPQALVC